MTLKKTWEFQTNLVGKNEEEPENWDKARKKDLNVKSPEEDKDQDLVSETDDDKCKQSSDCMRHSKTSKQWRHHSFLIIVQDTLKYASAIPSIVRRTDALKKKINK